MGESVTSCQNSYLGTYIATPGTCLICCQPPPAHILSLHSELTVKRQEIHDQARDWASSPSSSSSSSRASEASDPRSIRRGRCLHGRKPRYQRAMPADDKRLALHPPTPAPPADLQAGKAPVPGAGLAVVLQAEGKPPTSPKRVPHTRPGLLDGGRDVTGRKRVLNFDGPRGLEP